MHPESDRPPARRERVLTGTAGLDDVLGGGFPAEGLYLVVGSPGAGKTTLALQFLLEGRRRGERCLYITLSELRRELENTARSHGWSLEEVPIFESFLSSDRVAEENTGLSPIRGHWASG